MQKDLLGQDVFLIGPPGPLRRSLAMMYLVSHLIIFLTLDIFAAVVNKLTVSDAKQLIASPVSNHRPTNDSNE